MTTPSKLIEAAREFRALKDEKEGLEASEKLVNARIKQLETEIIPQLMDENSIDKFTVEGVGTIFQQVKVYASVKAEFTETFHNWLRENGHDDLIKPTVHPSTLKSFAQEQLEAGEELPEWLTAYKVPTAMLRRK
jgi:hypothetical protein